MNGPDRVSWLKYYIAQPIKSNCSALGDKIQSAFDQVGNILKV